MDETLRREGAIQEGKMMSSDLGVIVDLLLILAGIVVVAKGASLFIDTSVAAARSFGVSQHVIGITLVAFATSLPELAVSSVASRQGNGGIAIGNVIGSNVANITLALGITALFFPLVSSKRGLKDTIIMTGCTLLFWVFLFTAGSLDQIEGVVLFILYILFLFHITRRATKEGVEEGEWEEDAESRWENKSTWLLVMISLALGSLVVLGAHVMVLGAAGMASRMGISDLAIGGTIVAVGTSLPEISASLAAGLKKRHAIALGNVVGSNVMNILMVLGVAAIIAPAGFISPVSAGSDPQVLQNVLWIAMPFLMLVSLIMVPLAARKKIGRWSALPLLMLYGAFILLLSIFMGGA